MESQENLATIFQFSNSCREAIPEGFFDDFPNLKVIFWGRRMGKIGEGVIPNRRIVLVLTRNHLSRGIRSNVPKKVAVAIHIRSMNKSFRYGRDIIFNYSHTYLKGAFTDLEYDTGMWIVPVTSKCVKIKSFSDYWKHIESAPIEGSNDNSGDECCICFENKAGKHKLYPCDHTDVCIDCINRIHKCPLCRRDIQDVKRVVV